MKPAKKAEGEEYTLSPRHGQRVAERALSGKQKEERVRGGVQRRVELAACD